MPTGTTEDSRHDATATWLLPMVNAAQDAFLMLNEEGRILFWKRGAERLFGYSVEETRARVLHEWLVPERYRSASRDGFAAFAANSTGVVMDKTLELVALRKGGEEFPIKLSVSTLQIDGRWHAIAVIRDVSAHKAADQAYRAQRENFLYLMDKLPVGVIVVDRHLVVREANLTALQMMGRTRNEVVGTGCRRHIGADEDYPCPYYELGMNLDHSERVLSRKDGREISILKTVFPVALEGEEMLLEAFVDMSLQRELLDEHDELIARLRAAQEQLIQSEKMAAIGQLAAGVAHEINNPIGYIHSNLSSLQSYLTDLTRLLQRYREAESQLSEEERHCLETLRGEIDLEFLLGDLAALVGESREGAERVRRIVKDLKDFSHVDDGEWLWANLHAGLDSTLNVAYNELKYKAEVIKKYGELPQVFCLPAQINQVFMNLLINAAQAIPEHGTITVHTGTAEGGDVWVEIADTETGIAPEHLRQVFEPFFTTKAVGKGTGLGLSLSYGIVEKHGGRMEVESAVGKGTRFSVWLPIAGPAGVADLVGNPEAGRRGWRQV